jgi:hypothetical protein
LLRSSSIEDILCLCGFAIGGFSSGRDNRSCGNYKVKDEGGLWILIFILAFKLLSIKVVVVEN